jgi:hypothetical protein
VTRASEVDVAWLAGLIDGEGSVGISTKGVPAIQIEMTHKPTTDRVVEICGTLGISALQYGYRASNADKHRHKDSWHVHVTRQRDVLVLASAITPYSVTKQDQLNLIASYVSSRLSARKGPLTSEELAVIYDLKAINRRGPS